MCNFNFFYKFCRKFKKKSQKGVDKGFFRVYNRCCKGKGVFKGYTLRDVFLFLKKIYAPVVFVQQW